MALRRVVSILLGLVATVASRPVWAQCTENYRGCVEIVPHVAKPIPCFNVSCDRMIMRGPSSDRGFPTKKSWVYAGWPVYGPLQIDLTGEQVRAALALGIQTWTSINDSLPKDDLHPSQYDTDNYAIRWVSQEELGPGTLAHTEPTVNVPPYLCRISNTEIEFAIDPIDPRNGAQLMWSSCAPMSCAGNKIDLRTAVVHEFGHAYGLHHSCGDPTATMYGAVDIPAFKDTFMLTPTAAERGLLRQMYRDNFAPAVVESFVVVQSGSGLECRWATVVEVDCTRFVVSKLCADGRRYRVAGDILCQGPGVEYSLVDGVSSATPVEYTLGMVVERLGEIPEEHVVATWSAPENQMVAAKLAASGIPPEDDGGGYTSYGELLDALARGVNEGNPALVKSALADGFIYQLEGGLWWGRAVERLIQAASKQCYVEYGITPDALSLTIEESQIMTPTLSRIAVRAHYARLGLASVAGMEPGAVIECGWDPCEWTGEMEVFVERRNAEDGWRIRKMVEARVTSAVGGRVAGSR